MLTGANEPTEPGEPPTHLEAAEPDAWPPGVVLHERYEIRSRIGRGGMGVVYRAHDRQLGRDVAVKRLPREEWPSGTALARFEREMRLTSSVAHPNVVVVHDWKGPEQGGPYLVLELVAGETLAARLERLGRLPLDEAVTLVRQLLDALAAMHPAVIHRDLKPQNLIVYERPGTGEPFVKVLDFGVARAAHGESLTISGSIIGTLSYLSPEALSGAPADAQQDLWAVAVLFYECLSGRVPFHVSRADFSSDVAWLYAVAELTRNGLTDAKEVPASLQELFLRWLHADRARRPGTAAAALTELSDATSMDPAVRPAFWSRSGPRRTLSALAAASAVLAAVVGLAPSVPQPNAGAFRTSSAHVQLDPVASLLRRLPHAQVTLAYDVSVLRDAIAGPFLDMLWRSGPASRFGAGKVDDPRRFGRAQAILGRMPPAGNQGEPTFTSVLDPGLASPSLTTAWASDLAGPPARRADGIAVWVVPELHGVMCVTAQGDLVESNSDHAEGLCTGLATAAAVGPLETLLVARQPAVLLLFDTAGLQTPFGAPSRIGVGLSMGSSSGPSKLDVRAILELPDRAAAEQARVAVKALLKDAGQELEKLAAIPPEAVAAMLAPVWQGLASRLGIQQGPPALGAVPALPFADFLGSVARGASVDDRLLVLDGHFVYSDPALGAAFEPLLGALRAAFESVAYPDAPARPNGATVVVPAPEIIRAAEADSDRVFPLCDTQVGRVLMGSDESCRARDAAEGAARDRLWSSVGVLAGLCAVALVAWRAGKRWPRRRPIPALAGSLVALLLGSAVLLPRALTSLGGLRGESRPIELAALRDGRVAPGSWVRVEAATLGSPVVVSVSESTGTAQRRFELLVPRLDAFEPEVLAPGHAGQAVPVMVAADDHRALGLGASLHLAPARVACAESAVGTTLEALQRLAPASVEGLVVELPSGLADVACQGEPRYPALAALGRDALFGADRAVGIVAGARPEVLPAVVMAVCALLALLLGAALYSVITRSRSRAGSSA